MGTRIFAAIAVIATIVAGYEYSQDLRWHRRYNTAISDHTMRRVMDVRAAMARATGPMIVILGDSITERAHLPDTFEDRAIVNAGISGATVEQMRRLIPVLFESGKPARIVVALGMNNRGRGDVAESYSQLLAMLRPICPDLAAIAVTPAQGADAVNAQIRVATVAAGVPFIDTGMPAETQDDIHPNERGYAVWVPAILRATQPQIVAGG